MKILKQAQTLPPTLQGNTTVSGVKAVIMHMITFLLLTSKILFLCFSYIQIFTGMFTLPDDASLLLVVWCHLGIQSLFSFINIYFLISFD